MADNDILFRAWPLSDWPWGGVSGSLCIFDTVQWTDQNGLVRLQNIEQSVAEPLQRCPILVNGRSAVVQDFYYQPTLLAVDRPQSTRTGVIFDADDNYYYVLFNGYVFPELPSPMTWKDFVLYNHSHRRARMQDRYYDAAQVDAKFLGIQIISEVDLARLVTACGSAAMVNGVAVVPSVLVTATSLIKAWSLSNGVTGSIRIPFDLVNVGVDFTVMSSNDLDDGLIGWEIREPF